jgi:hypothetical protein
MHYQLDMRQVDLVPYPAAELRSQARSAGVAGYGTKVDQRLL